MIIPDEATMIKYKAILNMEPPTGKFVNIDWKRTRQRLPKGIKYEMGYNAISDIIDKLVRRWTQKRTNVSKLRSIIRRIKHG